MESARFPPRPSRLSESSDSLPVDPFRRAEALTRCDLYWLPSSFPARKKQRKWTLLFFSELVKRLAPNGELQIELFIESDGVFPDRLDEFTQTALDFNPVMGFSRRPGAPLASIPQDEHAQAVRRQEKPFEMKSFLKGTCYHFLIKHPEKQLDLFWGFGGMTMFLVKPDPAAKQAMEIPAGVKKHPAFQALSQQFDVQGAIQMASSIQSGFLKKSKEYFGKGWEDRVEYRGLLYVLPRWSSEDFFQLPEDDLKHLFEVCDLFVTESPSDEGILLASAKPLRSIIHELVSSLREAGEVFPN
jgi:hypothetical protein